MSILVVCPHCEHEFPPGKVPRDRKLACPGCMKLFLVTAERLREVEGPAGTSPAAHPGPPTETSWATFRDGSALVCRGLLIEAAALAAILVIPWVITGATPADAAGLRVLTMASVLALAAGSGTVALGRTRQAQHPRVEAEALPSRLIAHVSWGSVAAFALAVVPVLAFATYVSVTQSRTPSTRPSVADAVSRENTAFLLIHLCMLGLLVSGACRLAGDIGSTVHIAFVAHGARTAGLRERVGELNAIARLLGGGFGLLLVVGYAAIVSDPTSWTGTAVAAPTDGGRVVVAVTFLVELAYLYFHLMLNQTAHEIAAEIGPRPAEPGAEPELDPDADE